MKASHGWRMLRCALFALALPAPAAVAQDVPPEEVTPQEIFERAMGARARGDLADAIRSFRAILDANPSLSRARLELAVAYYHALDHRAALEQARAVLADPALPPAVRANVEALIARLEAEAAPHRFSATASIGLLYDSNVSAGPSSPGLSLAPDAVKRGDSAINFALGISHRYLAQARPGIGGRDGTLLWQSQVLFNQITYWHESDFDLRVVTLTTGPAWISPPYLRVSAPLQLDRLELGGEDYLDILGTSPAVVFGNITKMEVQLDGQLQRRAYRRAIDDGRDSHYYGFGLQASRVVSGVTLQAGARLNRDNADDAQWDYHGNEWFGLVAGRLVGRTTGYLRYSYLRSIYEQPDPVAGAFRTDRESRWALGASYRFGTDGQWSINLSALDINHRSDVPFYAYDRRQGSLTLTRGY